MRNCVDLRPHVNVGTKMAYRKGANRAPRTVHWGRAFDGKNESGETW